MLIVLKSISLLRKYELLPAGLLDIIKFVTSCILLCVYIEERKKNGEKKGYRRREIGREIKRKIKRGRDCRLQLLLACHSTWLVARSPNFTTSISNKRQEREETDGGSVITYNS